MNTVGSTVPPDMTDFRPPSHAPDAEITLGLLNAVHENSGLTQRTAARDMGIALGLVNAYLKRSVTKGLIKIRAVPANRYSYFLTPKGFAEKSRLTAEFLGQSFSLFRQARAQYGEIFSYCAARDWRAVSLVGISDLAEIALLCAQDSPITLVGAIETNRNKPFLGLPVAANPAGLPATDALVITALGDAEVAYERATTWFPAERVLAPRLLGIGRPRDAAKTVRASHG